MGGIIPGRLWIFGNDSENVMEGDSINAAATDPNAMAMWVGAGLVLLGIVIYAHCERKI